MHTFPGPRLDEVRWKITECPVAGSVDTTGGREFDFRRLATFPEVFVVELALECHLMVTVLDIGRLRGSVELGNLTIFRCQAIFCLNHDQS